VNLKVMYLWGKRKRR